MIELPNEVWKQMTQEETDELLCRDFCGTFQYSPDGSVTIMMGMWAYKRAEEYRKEMIQKYQSNERHEISHDLSHS